jgi:hypothetical protein
MKILTGCKNNGLAVQVKGVYLCANIFDPLTLILNTLLLIFLSGLVILLVLAFTRKNRDFLIRGCIFLALLIVVTSVLRFIILKEEHAANPADSLSTGVPAGHFSPAFYQSVENVFTTYLTMVNLFEKEESGTIAESGKQLKTALDSLNIEELVADTVLYDAVYLSLDNARAEIKAIIEDPDLGEKRASLNILSQEFFNILTALQIQQPAFRYFRCDKAFGEGNTGYWIGNQQTANPYGIKDCASVDKLIGAGTDEQTKTK